MEVAVFDRDVERVTERLTARNDRHLVNGERAAHEMGHERVPGLVVGEDALLLLRDHAPLLQTGDDTLHCSVEVLRRDRLRPATAGEDRCLVGDVREIGARQAGRLARDDLEIDVGIERLALRVDAEDLDRGP